MNTIRIMVIDDFKNALHLWKNTEGIGLTGSDDSRKSIKKFLEMNPRTCFVAENDNGELTGTIMGGTDGRRGHIYHLTVKPEYRRQGLGKKLLEKTEKAFKKEGIRKTFLVALRNNKTGNKFWENNGYKIRKDLNYRDKWIDE